MGIPLASSFDMNVQLPLDSRFIKADVTARDAIGSGIRFEGMLVYVIATAKMYQLQGGIANGNWVEVGSSGTFSGDVIVGGYLKRSNASTITAFAGGGQSSATALAKDINRISTCASTGDSVKLPAGVAGMCVFVHNDGANAADIFPFLGDFIDSLAADTAIQLKAGKNVMLFCTSTGKWKSFSGGGGSSRVVSSSLSLANATAITIDTTLYDQTILVQGGSGAVVALATGPFGPTAPPDGARITLIGNHDDNTVSLAFSDTSKGYVGPNVTLAKYDSVTVEFNTTLNRYVLVSRSN